MATSLIERLLVSSVLSHIKNVVYGHGFSVEDMKTYCGILKEIGWYEKSCGFICGKEDLATWNPLEVAKILPLWGTGKITTKITTFETLFL